MTCRDLHSSTMDFRFCPDDLPPAADRMQAVMYCLIRDELTGKIIQSEISVNSSAGNMSGRTVRNGLCGLVCNPMRSLPGLRSSGTEIIMEVRAKRYLPRILRGTLGPFNTAVGHPDNYPDCFAPVDLGSVDLHRMSTRIHGHCRLDNGSSGSSLSGAEISVQGIWRTFPAADIDHDIVMEQPNIITLRNGLYGNRTSGSDSVHVRVFTPGVGEEKCLRRPAMAGDSEVMISDRVNLAAGDVVAFSEGGADITEYMGLAWIDDSAPEHRPTTIRLIYPLKYNHREGSEIVRQGVASAMTSCAVSCDAIPDDQTLFVEQLDYLDNATVEISGSDPPEYHVTGLYRVTSDSNGFFCLPPISRVAMMRFRVEHSSQSVDIVRLFSPNYELPENRIMFIFS